MDTLRTDVMSKLSNATCILRQMGVIDDSGDIDPDRVKRKYAEVRQRFNYKRPNANLK